MANSLTAHQATIVGQEALKVLRKNTVMPKLVTNFFGSEAQTQGSSIKVPLVGALTTNNKTAQSAVTVQNATSTNATINLNQHKEVTVIIDDIDKAISTGNLAELYLGSAVTSMAETIDASLTGLYSGVSTTVDGTGGVNAAIMRSVRKALSDAKNPNADRYFVAGTEAYSALLGVAEFTSAEKYGSSIPVMEGELGRIYGMKVFESQSIVNATNDQNLAFHKSAFGLAVRPLPLDARGGDVVQKIVTDPVSGLSLRVTMWYNADKLGTQVTVDCLYGVAELRDASAVVVTS